MASAQLVEWQRRNPDPSLPDGGVGTTEVRDDWGDEEEKEEKRDAFNVEMERQETLFKQQAETAAAAAAKRRRRAAAADEMRDSSWNSGTEEKREDDDDAAAAAASRDHGDGGRVDDESDMKFAKGRYHSYMKFRSAMRKVLQANRVLRTMKSSNDNTTTGAAAAAKEGAPDDETSDDTPDETETAPAGRDDDGDGDGSDDEENTSLGRRGPKKLRLFARLKAQAEARSKGSQLYAALREAQKKEKHAAVVADPGSPATAGGANDPRSWMTTGFGMHAEIASLMNP